MSVCVGYPLAHVMVDGGNLVALIAVAANRAGVGGISAGCAGGRRYRAVIKDVRRLVNFFLTGCAYVPVICRVCRPFVSGGVYVLSGKRRLSVGNGIFFLINVGYAYILNADGYTGGRLCAVSQNQFKRKRDFCIRSYIIFRALAETGE